MSSLDLRTKEVAQNVAQTGAVGSDPVVRKVGGELFVVNRADGNNVTVLDAASFEVKAQLATGAGSNPQDVAVVGSKLYVPALGTAGVVVITRGTAALDTISLASLDVDGKPDCVSAYAVGTDVYVVCGLLDASFLPRGRGKVVVIDSATDTVRKTLTLTNKNPFGVFEQIPTGADGELVIPTVPSFADFATGCVERITPGVDPVAGGCLVSNAAVEGLVSRIAFQNLGATRIMWMIVSSFDTEAHGNLQGFDLGADSLWPEPISAATQVLGDVAVCPDESVVVAEQTMASNGLRVYEGGHETTTTPLPVGLKPTSTHGLVCY
jgi:DNA-binding beta-propeller fold protein YncE